MHSDCHLFYTFLSCLITNNLYERAVINSNQIEESVAVNV